MKIEKLSNGLWVPSMDAQIQQWRENGHPYMQDTCLKKLLEWCKIQNKKFNLIVDIGAWCGTWTLSMQQYAKNIYCYEPKKSHFECLSRNVSTHNHVRLYNQAVGNEDGFIRLTDESATQNTRVLLEKGDIKINRLDSLELKDVDFIKIDVEGFEMEVLKGAEQTLKSVEYLMIELNGNTEKYGSTKKEVKEHLKSLGFRVLIKTWPDIVYFKA